MLTTVVLVAALSLAPQQAGTLTLSNVRTTYGVPGLPRTGTLLLPGDQLTIAFEMDGITIDPNGRVLYSTAVEVADSKGKMLFKQEPRDLEALAALGGRSVPAMVALDVGLEQPPGEYTVKVAVVDRANKSSAVLSRTFRVSPPGFGIVRLTTTADPEAQVPVGVFQVGGSLWVNTAVVGFARDRSKGQPDVAIELRILDENGKPTLAKPFVGEINDKVPSNARSLPVQFLIPLNRAGKFTLELNASCRLSKGTATLSLPLTVMPSK